MIHKTITFRGSASDLATDVVALLTPTQFVEFCGALQRKVLELASPQGRSDRCIIAGGNGDSCAACNGIGDKHQETRR